MMMMRRRRRRKLTIIIQAFVLLWCNEIKKSNNKRNSMTRATGVFN